MASPLRFLMKGLALKLLASSTALASVQQELHQTQSQLEGHSRQSLGLGAETWSHPPKAMGTVSLFSLAEEEATQGKPLFEGCASPAAQAEEPTAEPSADEAVQKATETTPTRGEARDPTTVVAGETEAPARQTSPSISFTTYFLSCSCCFS